MRARAFTGTLLLMLLALSATFSYSQAPQGFSYQAVIRNSTGVVIANQSVSLRISLLAADATAYYVETQTAITTANGLVNLTVGGGTLVSGSFAAVPWSGGDIRLKVEVDPAGGTAFVNMGTTRFYSVPYALFAANGPAGPIGPAGKGIFSVADNGNGTLTFTFTDNSTFTTPNLTGLQGLKGDTGEQGPTGPQGPEGPKGDTGNGIATVVENGNGAITFNFTDSSTFTTPNLTGPQGVKGDTGAQGPAGPQGEKGNTGNGIATVMDNGNGVITFTFTDGSTYVTSNLTGPTGPQGIPGGIGPQGPVGEKGDKGDTGNQGLTGDTGNGITSVMDNANGTLTFNFTNGSTYTTPDLTGPEGIQGLPGAVGSQGPAGPKGDKGDTGDQGIQGIPGTGLNNKGEWTSGTTYGPGDYVFSESSASSTVNTMWIVQASAAFSSSTLPKSDLTNWVEFEAPAGPQGPQGPVGPLVPGTAGQTLRHDGTTWVANSTLFNDGTNVGIGTTNPTHNLEVNGFARIGNVALNAGVEIDYNVYSDSRGRIFGYNRTSNAYNGLRLEGSDVLINANSGGKVGIGTIIPAKKLQIHNTTADAHLYISNTAPSIQLGNNEVFGSSTMYGLFALATINGHYGVNAGDVILGSYGNSRGNIYINSNYSGTGVKNIIMQPVTGNVGIGTTYPFANLTVRTATDRNVGIRQNSTKTELFSANDANNAYSILEVNASTLTLNHQSGGNVGIGTTTPGYKLDVVGRSRFQTGNGSAGIWFMNNANTAERSFYGMYDDNLAGIYGIGSGWGLLMNLNNGNVGIGTTNPNGKLQVQGDIFLPYYAGNSVLTMVMGNGNGMFFKPESDAIRIQSNHTGNPTIMLLDKYGQVSIGSKISAGSYGLNAGNLNGYSMELGGPAPSATNGQATIYLHHWGAVAHQLRYASTTLYLEAAGNGYGTTTTPSFFVGGPLYAGVNGGKIGIGTPTPTAKLTVQAAPTDLDDDILFSVKDKAGNNVFIVYPDAVQVIVPTTAKSSQRGAFVVSGRGTTKGETNFVNLKKTNYFIGHNVAPNVTTGTSNSIVGYESGITLSSGSLNTVLGFQAGKNLTTANANVFIGETAGFSNTTQGGQIFIGRSAGYSNLTGDNNIFIGTTSALNNVGGSENVMLGYETGYYSSGSYNTFIGNRAGRSLFNSSAAYYNVFVGNNAGWRNNGGGRNVSIGSSAGYNNETGSYNVFIGYNAGYNETGSYRLYIDKSSTAYPLIWGDFSGRRLVINGNETNNVNNRTLFSNGSAGGTTVWNNDSDVRLKTDIQTITNAIEKVMGLRGVNFKWKDNREEGVRIGFIAQETIKVLPEVVSAGEIYSMQYAPIAALLVEAIKEQQKQLNVKDKEINELKSRLDAIEKLLKMQAK